MLRVDHLKPDHVDVVIYMFQAVVMQSQIHLKVQLSILILNRCIVTIQVKALHIVLGGTLGNHSYVYFVDYGALKALERSRLCDAFI